MPRRRNTLPINDLFVYAADYYTETVIYRVTNLINGNHYIGITRTNVSARWRQHRYDARKGSRLLLHKAIRKYGEDNFRIEEIQRVPTYHEAWEEEKRWIAETSPVYNIAVGGRGNIGYRHPPEVLERIREKLIGRPSWNKGRVAPLSTREKISAHKKANPVRYWLGKKRAPDTIKKMSAALLGKPKPSERTEAQLEVLRRVNEWQRARGKKIRCLVSGRLFNSVTEASKTLGISKSSVVHACSKASATYRHPLAFVEGEDGN